MGQRLFFPLSPAAFAGGGCGMTVAGAVSGIEGSRWNR
jgi:hypothetical protein